MSLQTLSVDGQIIPFNEQGYITDFHLWNEEVARELAAQDGLVLTDCHWKAIRFIREFYAEYETPPSPRVMITKIGNELHHYRCTYGTLNELFPKGGCKQACRLAGLPEGYCHAC